MSRVDPAAYRFMRDNGGWIVGRRAECALHLARAEQLLEQAIELGVASVEWVDDDEPYDPGDDDPEYVARQFESNAWTGPYGCILRINGEHAESLWGIVVGQWGTGDPYCRVIAAELASQASDELRQAIGDTLDAREGMIV